MFKKIHELIIKVGFLVIAFAGAMIITSLIIWLLLAKEEKTLWVTFLTAFPLPILLSIIGAVGANKVVDKIMNKVKGKVSGKIKG